MKVLQINTDGSRLMKDIGGTIEEQNERIWNMLGGFFGIVRLGRIVRLGKDAAMLVDDEGFLKHLPLNPAAMMISGYPSLAGTALIVGVRMTDDGEIFTDCPQRYHDLI